MRTGEFTLENTQGYSQGELNELNANVLKIAGPYPVDDDASIWDNIAESVRTDFDNRLNRSNCGYK